MCCCFYFVCARIDFLMNLIQQLSPQEAYEHLIQGAILVDVREEDEISEIACGIDFVNIPMSRFQMAVQSLPQDKELVTVCRSGGRSLVAAQLLQSFGFEKIYNISGGISAWEQSGLPIT